MGKSVGFIGNFKGKLGNAVGYKVSQSNSGTNQGVRVYQPNIKNPKSAAQAEQRAKYAPIFATYNALKSIIDRGNESKPYGNASRIAWLKKAFRAEDMSWFEKGKNISAPVLCDITQGSIQCPLNVEGYKHSVNLEANAVDPTWTKEVHVISSLLISQYPNLKYGDQLTFVLIDNSDGNLVTFYESFVLTSQEDIPLSNSFKYIDDYLVYQPDSSNGIACAVIVSRLGKDGRFLRSISRLILCAGADTDPYGADAKEAAIKSYMESNTSTDWAEESIQ